MVNSQKYLTRMFIIRITINSYVEIIFQKISRKPKPKPRKLKNQAQLGNSIETMNQLEGPLQVIIIGTENCFWVF